MKVYLPKLIATSALAYLALISANHIFTFGKFSLPVFLCALLSCTIFAFALILGHQLIRIGLLIAGIVLVIYFLRNAYHVDVIGDAEFYVNNALHQKKIGSPEFPPAILQSGMLASFMLGTFMNHGAIALRVFGIIFASTILFFTFCALRPSANKGNGPILMVIPTSIFLFLFNSYYLELYAPATFFSILIVIAFVLPESRRSVNFFGIDFKLLLVGVLLGASFSAHGVFLIYLPGAMLVSMISSDEIRIQITRCFRLVVGFGIAAISCFLLLRLSSMPIIAGNIHGGSDGNLLRNGYFSWQQAKHALGVFFLAIFPVITIGISSMRDTNQLKSFFLSRYVQIAILGNALAVMIFLLSYGFDLTLRTDIDLQLTACFPLFGLAIYYLNRSISFTQESNRTLLIKDRVITYTLLTPMCLVSSIVFSRILYWSS